MVILDSEQRRIVNFDKVTVIFLSSDEHSIKINFADGTGSHLERYSTAEECKEALKMLYEGLKQGSSVIMPNKEQVQIRLRAMKGQYIRHSGKKTKGHGGS